MIKKTLGKETIIYGVGRVLASSVAFLLLPFYSHALTSIEDYGLIQIIAAFIAFSNIIFLFAFDASLMKHYAGENSENRTMYLSNTYFSLIITSTLFATLLILFRTFFSTIIIAGNSPDWITKIAFILFFDSLRSIHLLVLRAENKAYNFMTLQVLDIVLLTSLNIYFVGFGFENNKVEGVIHANFLSSIIMFIISFPIIFNRFDFSTLSIKAWKKIKTFALPLVPAGLFWIILEFSDRKMLEFLLPQEVALNEVGIYGAGYKLGALMLLLVYAFNYAWRPYFLKTNEQKDFTKISNYVFYFLGGFWIILILFIENITAITIPIINKPLINSEYLQGLSIVPFIALSYVFHASFVLQESGPFLKNKTQIISVCRGIGVFINIVLNIILIPYYHQWNQAHLGAAIATFGAYSIMSIVIYIWNQSLFDFKYTWKIVLPILTCMMLAWFLSTYNNIGLNFMLTIVYIGCYNYINKANTVE